MGYFGALQISDCTFNLIYTVNLIYRFPACVIYNYALDCDHCSLDI